MFGYARKNDLDCAIRRIAQLEKQIKMSATRADLDSAIDNIGAQIQTTAASINKTIQTMKDQLAEAQAQGNPPPDFTEDLNKLAADGAALAAIGTTPAAAPAPESSSSSDSSESAD